MLSGTIRVTVWLLIVDWILLTLRFTFKPHEITTMRIIPAVFLTAVVLALYQFERWIERKRAAAQLIEQ